MLVSYKAAYHLIDRFYKRKSLNGFITDCKEYFDEALQQAKELEDYDFLESLVNQKDTFDNEFTIFFNYKNNLPTVLNKNQDLSIEAFAYLCVDCIDIPINEFKDVINSQAIGKGLTPKEMIKEFESCMEQIKNYYRLVQEKIGRNEQCPCGSGKKFKQCHGAHK